MATLNVLPLDIEVSTSLGYGTDGLDINSNTRIDWIRTHDW